MKKLTVFFSSLMIIAFLTGCPTISGNNGGSGDGGKTADTVINIASIAGLTPPSLGEIPVSVIKETAQYTGTVSWDGGWSWSSRFGGNKAYTATISLTAKSGYTVSGVTANFFTVAGATTVSNNADSGVVKVVFPATASVSVGDSALGGKVGYILQSGDTGYVAGEQRGLIAATADQSSMGIIWAVAAYQSTSVPGTGTDLGTGSANTDRIIAQNGAGSAYAAGLSRAYNGGSYTDWYLPSKDELEKIYNNRVAIGGFTTAYYWSSSEYDAKNVCLRNFKTGDPDFYLKSWTYLVRSVRSF
jgi:hypothetical protein